MRHALHLVWGQVAGARYDSQRVAGKRIDSKYINQEERQRHVGLSVVASELNSRLVIMDGMMRSGTLSRFAKSEDPLWLDAARTHALAVLPEGAKVSVLLDGNLKRLDITEAERLSIKAGIARVHGTKQ